MPVTLNASTSSGLIQTADTSGQIELQTNGTTVATVNTSNNVQFRGSISVGNVTPTTSGAGITFPATQSASSDANTLDDYEEGTWTPTLTGDGGSSGITYDSRLASYIKIGNLITIDGYILLTGKTSITGNVIITGLPFTGKTNINVPINWGYWAGVTQNWVSVGGWLNGGNTLYLGGRKTAGGVIETLLNADVGTSFRINFSVTYSI